MEVEVGIGKEPLSAVTDKTLRIEDRYLVGV